MENREFVKKFISSYMGGDIYSMQLTASIYARILPQTIGCSQKDINDLLMEIQEETQQIVDESIGVSPDIKNTYIVVAHNLEKSWKLLSQLSPETADLYLDNNVHIIEQKPSGVIDEEPF